MKGQMYLRLIVCYVPVTLFEQFIGCNLYGFQIPNCQSYLY